MTHSHCILIVLRQKFHGARNFLLDNFYMGLAPGLNPHLERQGTHEVGRCVRVRVEVLDLARSGIQRLRELKGP